MNVLVDEQAENVINFFKAIMVRAARHCLVSSLPTWPRHRTRAC
jgi:hypothetical protein